MTLAELADFLTKQGLELRSATLSRETPAHVIQFSCAPAQEEPAPSELSVKPTDNAEGDPDGLEKFLDRKGGLRP